MASETVAPPSRLNQAALARNLGVTRQAIADLIQRGILVPDTDGKLDVALAHQAIANSVRPSGKTAAAISPSAPAASPPAAPAAGKDASAQMSYHVAKTLREATEASIAQIKLQQMQGNLIDRELAVQAAFTAFRTLRDALGYLPRQLAEKLAAITSPHEIEILVQDALREILAAYANKTLPKLTSRMGSATSVEAAP